ncbi:ornithine cyclodeaminase family protein [Chelativorans alearense]|uniref:ornithine cyclodeaminase family protein n=1 Tax=Chelativorans alearense TaxID=2681495 RepID=UPI0013D1E6FB|nr:ornithine cyclodeaminase family protein [Chelativorans alearense]
MTILITEEESRDLIALDAAIPVIESMFRSAGQGETGNSERFELPAGDGYLLFRAGSLQAEGRVGFKLLSSFGSGPRLMWNFLYDTRTGELLAIVQSRAISKLRTAAASAVAAKYLSPATASVVGMYGTGRQAEAQLAAICRVRPIKAAIVYGRDPKRRTEFCGAMSAQLGIDVSPVAAPQEVPRNADIIVTITNSEKPVLSANWLERPCLIVAVGANEWYEREIDETVVARAALVVVDDREDARRHCGDLLYAAAKDAFRWKDVVTLGEIVAESVETPAFGEGIILFESQGIALEDVAVTSAVYDAAVNAGLGREVKL